MNRSRCLIVIVCAGPLAWGQSPGSFMPAGTMTTPRAHHTATLLNDGRVLVAGGVPAWRMGVLNLDSAELYDPSTRTFTATGKMTAARNDHTATLLADGRVLIVGGMGSDGRSVVDTAEIYDPATGTFSATGKMTVPRWYTPATLLNNGKVLIAGGCTSGDNLSSAEIYDPSTGTFTATGNMTTGHCGPIAVPLASGKVLILPTNQGYDLGSPELFDADSWTFHPIDWTAPAQGYAASTANLLTDGKVLMTVSDNSYCFSPNPDAQLYDPATETFSGTGNTIGVRCDSTGTSLSDGTVLITGTYAPSGENPNELYDPASGAFSATGVMLVPGRFLHTATLLIDGKVLVTGGFYLVNQPGFQAPSCCLDSTELYTPAEPLPAAALISLSGDGTGQGAVQHAGTYQLVTADNPAVAGEIIVVYCTGFIDGAVIPPQVAIGGRLAEVLWFGNTPGYPGLNQINMRVPSGLAPGSSVPVRMNYIGRPSNQVTIGVR
jgi:hypothetical protein